MARDVTKIISEPTDLVLEADASVLGKFPLLAVGFAPEEISKVKGTPVGPGRDMTGAEVQGGMDFNLEGGSFEIGNKELAIADSFINQSCNWYYIGAKKYHKFSSVNPMTTFQGELSAKGKSLIGFSGKKNAAGLGNIYTADDRANLLANAEAVAAYYEALQNIRQENLETWINPRFGNFALPQYVFDTSLNRYVGSLNSDYATIWQTGVSPNHFLRFDGINDYLNLGNVDDLGSKDAIIEFWIRPKGADATEIAMIGKDAGGAGYRIYRTPGNEMQARLYDGASVFYPTSSSDGSVTQNGWKHVAMIIRRTGGNGLIFLNGAQSGNGISFATLGSMANAASLNIGRNISNYGNFDIEAFRIYIFDAGQMPTNFSQIIATHFGFERSYFDV